MSLQIDVVSAPGDNLLISQDKGHYLLSSLLRSIIRHLPLSISVEIIMPVKRVITG
ncbi:MAG: hypothetical protein WCK85_00560 [Chlorobium sp.]